MATRKYQKKRRAEQEAETRQRIVGATVALHRELGPARTSISAIAQRAGVERLTVYRHFQDERSILAACSAQFSAELPLPDPGRWAGIEEPAERLRTALSALYDYYRRGAEMLAHVIRDAQTVPAVAEAVAPLRHSISAMRRRLSEGWNVRGRRRDRLEAAVGHALRFETWQSLAEEEGLSDAEAAHLMAELACTVAEVSARH
jgi:AcrR family transcriptional regulator